MVLESQTKYVSLAQLDVTFVILLELILLVVKFVLMHLMDSISKMEKEMLALLIPLLAHMTEQMFW